MVGDTKRASLVRQAVGTMQLGLYLPSAHNTSWLPSTQSCPLASALCAWKSGSSVRASVKGPGFQWLGTLMTFDVHEDHYEHRLLGH